MKNIIILLVILLQIASAQITDKTKQVDAILQSYCQPNEPGMVIGIIQDGNVIYKNALGMADLSHRIPLTDSSVFNIASVSKQFTAFLTLLAVEEGKLELDDDIRKYLPELKMLPYKVSLRQLANHTHGLPNIDELLNIMGFGFEDPIPHSRTLEVALSIKQVNRKPGEKYEYGNTGFLLLAEILKRVYEEPFQSLIQKKVFAPLQMHNSRVIANANEVVTNKVQPYSRQDNAFMKFDNRQIGFGPSNIHSSIDDMLKWAINFLDPKVGNSNMFRAMMKNTVLNNNTQYEYGLGVQTETYKGLKIAFHGGGTAGYRAYILHAPEHNFSVVTLGNQAGFDGYFVAYQLVDLFLGDHQKITPPAKTTYSKAELKPLEGIYEMYPGNYYRITATDSTVLFGSFDQEGSSPLPIIGDNKFVFPFIPTASITFGKSAFDFRIADFIYICKKVEQPLKEVNNLEPEKYIGVYKNDEFKTSYEILLSGEQLVARHLLKGEIPIYPLAQETFYSKAAYFTKLDFKLDEEQNVEGFLLSGQNLRNIEFVKIR